MDRKPAARRALAMPRSAIREIMNLAAGRDGVIHLEIGDPDLITPSHIIAAGFAAARDGWTRYSPNAGLAELRELVAARVAGRSGTRIAASRVIITVGAVGALYSAVMCVVDAGDEVLIPDPGWPPYESMLHLAGATVIRFPLRPENGFVPDVEQAAGLVTDRTKAIMINTPSNPTGTVYPREAVEAIAHLARQCGLYVISDEIYEDIVFEGDHVSATEFGLDDRLFLVSGASKAYAMTGWRLGYVVCPDDLVSVVGALQEPVVSCAPTISQKAVEAALTGPQDCVGEFRDVFRRRRDMVAEVFAGTGLLPVTPHGAFYALIDIGERFAAGGSFAFAKRFLIERNIAVVPGITFGPSCDRYVRVAFTIADRELRRGIEELRDFILSPA